MDAFASQQARVVRVDLLHVLEEAPPDPAADDKRQVARSRAKDVGPVLADVFCADLAHVDPVVGQKPAADAERDDTPRAEDCAADRACWDSHPQKKKEDFFAVLSCVFFWTNI